MPNGYATTPIAQGGIAEPRFEQQLGQAQTFPAYKPSGAQEWLAEQRAKKAEEQKKTMEEPKMPEGIHPPLRRALEGASRKKYEELVQRFKNEKKDPAFWNEVDDFKNNMIGLGRDGKILSQNIEKLQTQITSKGIDAFKNPESYHKLWSNEFYEQHGEDILAMITTAEDEFGKIQIKPPATNIPKIQREVQALAKETFKAPTSKTDAHGNIIYTYEFNKDAYDATFDALVESRWKSSPIEQENYPDIQDFKDLMEPARETGTAKATIRAKSKEGETRGVGGYSKGSYSYTEGTFTVSPKASGIFFRDFSKAQRVDIPEQKAEEIIITRNDKSELSFLTFQDPKDRDKLIEMRPFSFRKLKDGWYLFGTAKYKDEEGKTIEEDVYVKYEKIEDKFRAKFGTTLEEILGEKSEGKETKKPSETKEIPEITSQKEYDALPKGAKYTSGGKTLIKK